MSNDTLPAFRDLTSSAVALHLAAVPLDGAALVLSDLVPCTPLADAALVRPLQGAQASLAGALAALATLQVGPARALNARLNAVSHAYHRALMAFYGVDVPERKAA